MLCLAAPGVVLDIVPNHMANDAADPFWPDPRVLRFGSGENLYGIEAIRAFRLARSSAGLDRTLKNTVITTFGTNFATANTEFYRDNNKARCGRQSQTWVRLDAGWRIVAAHVSIIEVLG